MLDKYNETWLSVILIDSLFRTGIKILQVQKQMMSKYIIKDIEISSDESDKEDSDEENSDKENHRSRRT